MSDLTVELHLMYIPIADYTNPFYRNHKRAVSELGYFFDVEMMLWCFFEVCPHQLEATKIRPRNLSAR